MSNISRNIEDVFNINRKMEAPTILNVPVIDEAPDRAVIERLQGMGWKDDEIARYFHITEEFLKNIIDPSFSDKPTKL
jgi:hypothetical protein